MPKRRYKVIQSTDSDESFACVAFSDELNRYIDEGWSLDEHGVKALHGSGYITFYATLFKKSGDEDLSAH